MSECLPETIAAAAQALRAGQVSCIELAEAYLDRIARFEPTLNAFITVTADQALATAAERDAELALGYDRGQLHGIPVVYKDNFDTKGILTSAGSAYFTSRVPNQDAVVVKLLQQAGTTMLGKNNMHEFATGGQDGHNAYFGAVCNPLDLNREPGGSSSGTAAAVAAGVCLAGLGSDTGGSIRGPAAYVGVVGLRPTFGLISTAGIFTRAQSLDCAGVFARTVADVAAMLEPLIEGDPTNTRSSSATVASPLAGLNNGIEGLRLGVVENYSMADVDTDVSTAFSAAVDTLNTLGADIVSVNIPVLAQPGTMIEFLDILMYEFSQALGPLFDSCKDQERLFSPPVHADMARGRQVTTDTYAELQRKRMKVTKDIRDAFRQVDAILTPTMPAFPPLRTADEAAPGRDRKFTFPFSVAGLPCVSVPVQTRSSSLSTGFQIIGDVLQDVKILRVGHALQMAWTADSGITDSRYPDIV